MIDIKKIEHLGVSRLEEISGAVENLLTDEEKITLDDIANPSRLLKAINNDKYAEINGREYHISIFTHKKRVKVWAYFTSVNVLIENGNYSFMDSNKFNEIEAIIFENTTFEKGKLSAKHFEKYPLDYVKYITTMMGVITYPFFAESLTN